MMKKALFGLVAVGSAVALRPLLLRSAHTAREHCEQMAERCMQIAARPAERR